MIAGVYIAAAIAVAYSLAWLHTWSDRQGEPLWRWLTRKARHE